MISTVLPVPVLRRPLYRGRELKYVEYKDEIIDHCRPLYRGRELKYVEYKDEIIDHCRPLYRGRELKYILHLMRRYIFITV